MLNAGLKGARVKGFKQTWKSSLSGNRCLQLQPVTRLDEWNIRGMTQDKIHEQMKQLGLAGNAEFEIQVLAVIFDRTFRDAQVQ